jgi:hypothetical protein
MVVFIQLAPEEPCSGGDMFEFVDLETLNASNHHEQQKIVSEIMVQISLHGHTNCNKS